MAVKTVTETFHPIGYDESLSSFDSIKNLENFIGESATNTTYAQWGLTKGSKAETFIFITFDFSSIPSNATINSVEAKIKVVGTGSASYVSPRQVRAYEDATTNIGYSTTLTTSVQTITLDLGSGDWDYNRIDHFMIRAYARRTSSNTSTNYYIRVYGADVTVNYSYEEQENIIYIKDNGSWSPINVSKAYKKVNGVWVEESDLTNVFDTTTKYIKGN